MNEEEYIRQQMGNKNPFTVPEGYFDSLANRVIDRLPGEGASLQKEEAGEGRPRPALVKYLRPLLYAAACVAFAVVATTIYDKAGEKSDEFMAQQEAVYNDSYIDEMADYAMIDNEDIYASLLADI